MTRAHLAARRALLALLVSMLAGGCLPIGFRGSSLYTSNSGALPVATLPAS